MRQCGNVIALLKRPIAKEVIMLLMTAMLMLTIVIVTMVMVSEKQFPLFAQLTKKLLLKCYVHNI